MCRQYLLTRKIVIVILGGHFKINCILLATLHRWLMQLSPGQQYKFFTDIAARPYVLLVWFVVGSVTDKYDTVLEKLLKRHVYLTIVYLSSLRKPCGKIKT